MQTQETAKSLYHRDDPDTSREAAERLIRSGALSRQEEIVCEAILNYVACVPTGMLVFSRTAPGFTAKELAVESGLDYYMISRRFSGLTNIIERTMFRRNGCAVWRLKPQESEVYENGKSTT